MPQATYRSSAQPGSDQNQGRYPSLRWVSLLAGELIALVGLAAAVAALLLAATALVPK